MTETEMEAFKQAWKEYPSQDNEGYQPDRGGFKSGWFAALEWSKYSQLRSDLDRVTREGHEVVTALTRVCKQYDELKQFSIKTVSDLTASQAQVKEMREALASFFKYGTRCKLYEIHKALSAPTSGKGEA